MLPQTTRALHIPAHGGPDVLTLVDNHPVTPPGPGEVTVRVKAVALNHLDLFVRRGIPGVTLPVVPCSDGAGVIAAVGEGVTEFAEGDPVVLQPHTACGTCDACLSGQQNLCRHYAILGESRDGCARDTLTLPATSAIPKPECLSWAEAPAGLLAFLTAWQMLVTKARVTWRDTVLVHSVGSGVGHAAIQIAKRVCGAKTVIGTSRSQDKLDRAMRELPLDDAIQTGEQNPKWYRDVRERTGGRGAEVVVEHVGPATWAGSINAVAPGGRIVTCGSTTGPTVETPMAKLFFRNIAVLGSTMGTFKDMRDVVEMERRGVLKPVVDRVLPLAEARQAHEVLEGGEAFGKVVLALDDEVTA